MDREKNRKKLPKWAVAVIIIAAAAVIALVIILAIRLNAKEGTSDAKEGQETHEDGTDSQDAAGEDSDDTDADEAAGETSWSYEDGTLTISGSGNMENYEAEGAPWYSYADEITTLVIEEGITGIGDYSFYACTSLSTISIPSTVTKIGDYAFAFCESIVAFDLSGDITGIGDWAFYGCSGLVSIELPEELSSLGTGTFAYCTSLASVTIPDTVTGIGGYCFYCCNTLNEITVPENVSEIGGKAFSFCTALDYIYVDSANEYYTDADGVLFSADMQTLVAYPGGNDDADDYVYDIPESVCTIEAGAFEGNNWLSYINIPEGVTEIGEDAFNAGYWLEEINVDSANAAYSSEDGILYNKDKTELIMYPMGKNDTLTYEIPETVETIGNYAFYLNLYLEELVIPASVTEIGDYALYITYSLENIYYTGSEEEWDAVDIADANDLSGYSLSFDYTAQ